MRFCHYPSQAVQKYVCIGRADRRSADDSPGFVLVDLGTGGSQYKDHQLNHHHHRYQHYLVDDHADASVDERR